MLEWGLAVWQPFRGSTHGVRNIINTCRYLLGFALSDGALPESLHSTLKVYTLHGLNVPAEWSKVVGHRSDLKQAERGYFWLLSFLKLGLLFGAPEVELLQM